jgi:hypothetical protein
MVSSRCVIISSLAVTVAWSPQSAYSVSQSDYDTLGLEFLNLRILSANLITIPLGYAGQSIYIVLLKYLVVVLCIHKSDCSA